MPAFRQTRVNPRDALSSDQRTGSAAREALRLRGALVVCEVALACLLCFGTILLLRSSILSYTVRQRRKELGIRMALGATRSRILSTVVRDGLFLAALGVGFGLALAPAAARALSNQLYGVAKMDTITLLVAPLLILAVSLFASIMPAWRASRAEPISALRDQ